MAGVLPATSGDDTPSMPGPTEQSVRDHDGTLAGRVRSSDGGVALVVTTRAPGPRWRVPRRRVRRHVHRVATAVRLNRERPLPSPAVPARAPTRLSVPACPD